MEDRDFEQYTDSELIREDWENRVEAIVCGGDLRFESSTVAKCVEGEVEIIREGCQELVL
jgi:tRNA A37 threonylcarbamoyladenosine synthetase subunit TsaC/SUA5/YrdC